MLDVYSESYQYARSAKHKMQYVNVVSTSEGGRFGYRGMNVQIRFRDMMWRAFSWLRISQLHGSDVSWKFSNSWGC